MAPDIFLSKEKTTIKLLFHLVKDGLMEAKQNILKLIWLYDYMNKHFSDSLFKQLCSVSIVVNCSAISEFLALVKQNSFIIKSWKSM